MQTPQGVWTAVAGLPHLSKDDVIVIVSRLEEELLHRQRMVESLEKKLTAARDTPAPAPAPLPISTPQRRSAPPRSAGHGGARRAAPPGSTSRGGG